MVQLVYFIMKDCIYESPSINLIEVAVEAGFSSSIERSIRSEEEDW